jgi:TonB family protein
MRRLLAALLFALLWANNALAAEEKVHPKVDDRAIIAILVSAVRPEYPYEARLRRISGHGVAALKIDRASGKVISCEMVPSTGSAILDDAAIQAFREWRFKPGTIAGVRIPIAFLLPDQGGEFFTDYHAKGKSVDEALARFLGKGAIEEAPIPAYPRSVPWTTKQGKGVYEIHVRKDGIVSDVKILKRSGDNAFDRAAIYTLRLWRFRRGPLILELPLAFRLTPNHYALDIPKNH